MRPAPDTGNAKSSNEPPTQLVAGHRSGNAAIVHRAKCPNRPGRERGARHRSRHPRPAHPATAPSAASQLRCKPWLGSERFASYTGRTCEPPAPSRPLRGSPLRAGSGATGFPVADAILGVLKLRIPKRRGRSCSVTRDTHTCLRQRGVLSCNRKQNSLSANHCCT